MTPPPKDVNCRRLRGFHLDVCRDEEGNPNGLCENCTYAPSTHVFNIGATQHHLCAKCFAEMLMCFVGESVGHPVAQSAEDKVLEGCGAKKCERAPREEPKFVPILLSPDELQARRHKYAVEAVLRAKEWSKTLDMIDLGNKEDLKKVKGCDEKYIIVNSETIPPCITTNAHVNALMYSVERECSGKAIGERVFLTETESKLLDFLSNGLLKEYCTELNGWSDKQFPKTSKETLLVMQSVCIFANAVLSYEELPLTMGTISPMFPQTAGVKHCGQCLKKQIGDKGQCFCESQLRKYATILYRRDYFGTGDLKRCNGEENCVFFE